MRYGFLGALPLAAVALAIGASPVMAGKANDTLVWSTDREQDAVDPYYNNMRELVVIGHTMWDGLLSRNPETGEYGPLLAKSYKWIDKVTMEFKLREDVVFHDGSTFDADDVVYTVNHVAKKENGVLTWQNVKFMKSAEKVDKYTVRLNLHKPFPAALAYLAQVVFIMPEGHYDNAPLVIPEEPKEGTADATKKAEKKPESAAPMRDFGAVDPVGTGPYKFVDFVAGESITMEKNDSYFDGAKGQPTISKIVYRTIVEANTQIAELMIGGLDWIWDVPQDQALRLKDNFQVVNEKTMRISYIQFDVNGKSGVDFFTKKKVREAFAHAINREAIATHLVGPASAVIPSACHPDQWGCAQDVPKWEYNPELAKKQLTEAGYPNGFEVDFYGYRQPEFTESVIGDLAKIGVKINLKWPQYRALRDMVWENKTPINQMTWGSNSIPDASASTSHFFNGGRDDFAKDPDVMKWLASGDSETDPVKRKEYYKKALSKISGELYWLPMFTYAKYYAFSNELDFKPTSDEIPRFFTAKWK